MTATEMPTPTDLAEAYYRCWLARDFDTLRGLLADGCTFRGPLGTADDADTCITGLRGMSAILTDVVVHRRVVDGTDVVTWFDLHTTTAPPAPTASWMHVTDGRIASIRVFFDPRPLLGAPSAVAAPPSLRPGP